MNYFSSEIAHLQLKFPKASKEILKEAIKTGIKAFAWYKDGVQYVGSCGTQLSEALKEVDNA